MRIPESNPEFPDVRHCQFLSCFLSQPFPQLLFAMVAFFFSRASQPTLCVLCIRSDVSCEMSFNNLTFELKLSYHLTFSLFFFSCSGCINLYPTVSTFSQSATTEMKRLATPERRNFCAETCAAVPNCSGLVRKTSPLYAS